MLRYLLFFPSVTFAFSTAEIFPWAFIYSTLKIKSLNWRLMGFLGLIFISVVVVTLYYNFVYLFESMTSVAAYLNAVILFFLINQLSSAEVKKLAKMLRYVLAFMVVLGIFQTFAFFVQAEDFIRTLVPRAAGSQLGEGRGVTLLSSEPSRAAMEILFIYAAWRITVDLKSALMFVLDIAMALFIVLIIKSAVGLALLLIYLLAIYRIKFLISFFIVSPIFAVYFLDARSVELAYRLVSTGSINEFWSLLLNASGFRLVSVISAYYYSLTNVIGGGVGAWQVSSISAMQSVGFSPEEINYFIYHAESEFIGVRPTSFMANVALDMGVVGFVLISFALWPYIKKAWLYGEEIRPLLVIFLISTYFIGSVGNPVPWLALLIAIRWIEMCGHKQVFQENPQYSFELK